MADTIYIAPEPVGSTERPSSGGFVTGGIGDIELGDTKPNEYSEFKTPDQIATDRAVDLIVSDIIAKSKDPEATASAWEAAKTYSDVYGVTREMAFSDVDLYTEQYFGRLMPPKTAARSIKDHVESSFVSNRMGLEAAAYIYDHIGKEPTAEEELAFGARIEELQNKIQDLKYDAIPRHWTVELFKLLGSNAAPIIEAAGTAVITGGIGAAAGGAAKAAGLSAAKSALLKVAITTTGRIATTLPTLQGLDYVQMRDAGVTHEAAAVASSFSGGVNTALELFLGVESAVAGSINKSAKAIAVENLITRMHVSGKLTSFGASLATRITTTGLSEGATEGLQALTTDLTQMAAESFMADGLVTDPMTAQRLAKDVIENALVGALVGTAYGVVPSIVQTARDAKKIEELGNVADSFSKEGFEKVFIDSGAIDASAEVQRDVASSIWENRQTRSDKAAIMAKEKAVMKTGTAQAPVDRMASGELRVEMSSPQDTKEGFQIVDFIAASAKDGSQYATVSTIVKGNEVVISDASIDEKYEDLSDEMIERIADQYPSMKLTIDENADPIIRGAFARVSEANGPMGAQHNIISLVQDKAKAAELSRLRAELSQIGGFESRREQNLALSLAAAIPTARLKGLSIKEGASRGKAGAIEFEGSRASRLVTAKDAVDAARATIYLAKQSNPVAVAHELAHYYHQAFFDTPEMRTVEKAYGIKEGGSWDTKNLERFSNDMLRHIQTGVAPSPEAENLFKKMSKWIKDLWKGAIEAIDVHPEVRAAFNKWMSNENIVRIDSDAKTIPENKSEVKRSRKPEEKKEPSAKSGGSDDSEPNIRIVKPNEIEKYADRVAAAVRHTESLAGKTSASESRFEKKRKASIYSEKIRRLKTGEWIDDAELVAMVKGDEGLSKQIEEDREAMGFTDDDILYMSRSELDETKARLIEDLESESMQFGTIGEWLESMDISESDMNKGDKAFFDKVFNSSHNMAVPAKYPNRGDLIKEVAKEGGIERYLETVGDAIYRYGDKATASLIEKSPGIKEAIAKYRSENRFESSDRSKAIEAVSENEGLSILVFGSALGDTNIRNEGRARIRAMPELKSASPLFRMPGMNLADRAEIERSISDKGLKEEVKNRTITESGIDKRVEAIGLSKDQETKVKNELFEERSARNDLKHKSKDFEKSARDEARGEKKLIRAQYKEKQELRKLKLHVKALQSFVMGSPPASSGLKAVRKVELAQAILLGDKNAAINELSSIVFQNDKALADSVVRSISAMAGKPMSDWTLDELEMIASMFDSWIKTGRTEEKEMKLAQGMILKSARSQIVSDTAAARGYKKPITRGSVLDINRQKKMSSGRMLKMNDMSFQRTDAWVMKYLAPKIANSKDPGAAYDILIRQAHARLRSKFMGIDRRKAAVVKFYEDNKMKKTIFDQIVLNGVGISAEAGGPMDNVVVTRSQLIGIRNLIGTKDNFNQFQREALIYGSFFSNIEKNADGSLSVVDPPSVFNEDGNAVDLSFVEDVTIDTYYNQDGSEADISDYAAYRENPPPFNGGKEGYMESRYKEKLDKLLEYTETFLTENDKALGDLMLEAMDNSQDWARFANATYKITGKEPKKEKFYFPIFVTGGLEKNTGTEGADSFMEKLKDAGMHTFLEKGMTIDRKYIAPRNRHEIKYDSWPLFFDAIESQEHLINFGPYARDVRSIFLNTTFSGGLVEQIRSSVGEEGVSYLRDYIDLLTNPAKDSGRIPGETQLTFLRGSQIVANLAYRWTTVAMQLMTSPLPFMAEAPGELAAVAAEAYSTGLGMAKWYKAIEENSPILKNRQMSPEYAYLMGLDEKGFTGAFKKFAQIGMGGLVFADRLSVAIGWEAVRRKAAKTMSPEKARAYADEVVIKTQPASEEMFRSPAYRNMDTFKQLVFQFTQPLNVIWNNIRYDIPQSLREREYGKFAGYITAYALSGMAIGVIRSLRGRGPEEDDDDRAKVGFWLHAGVSQYIESIPLIGDTVSTLARAAMMGKRQTLFADSNIPAFESTAQALSAIIWAMDGHEMSKKQTMATIGKLFEGTGQMAGLPTRAISEYVDLANKVFGEEE